MWKRLMSAARNRAGLTQRELADRLGDGWSRESVQSVEREPLERFARVCRFMVAVGMHDSDILALVKESGRER